MEIDPNAALLPRPPSATVPEATAPEDGRPTADADFESFLRLLTAQLRNQDPLKPIDSTQFVAQLASFSTVEQLVQTNNRLDAMAAESAGNQVTALAGWIGREVSGIDGGFRATGEALRFGVPERAGADRVEAVIRTPEDVVLRRLAVTPGAPGGALWDGRDGDGRPIVGRDLAIELHYFAGDELIAAQPAEIFRVVTGVRGTGDGPVLDLADGSSIGPGDVARLRDPALADPVPEPGE